VNGGTVAGQCRLRFRAPDCGFELAVPSDVPLADLLPAVIGYGGPDLPEHGVEHGGWVVQRLGGPPLDENRTADELDLRDGELLFLRPRRETLPPVHFDDLVDGLSEVLRARGDSWRPALTHHAALGLCLLAAAVGGALLAMPGPVPARDLAAGISGLLLLVGAAAAVRAVGDRGAGVALAAAAVPFLALAGALLPSGPGGTASAGARLLAGASAAAGGSVLALAATACATPLFLGTGALAALAASAGGLLLAGLTAVQTAASVMVVTVVLASAIPAVAFRLSGLRLPPLPRNAGELQENIEPFQAAHVLRRAATADDHLTSFHLVFASASVAALTVLTRAAGDAGPWTAAVTCVLLSLHARGLVSVVQRLALLIAACYGVLSLIARAAPEIGADGRLIMVAALLLMATALLIAAWTLPGRRMLPYWGRAAELAHAAVAASLLPLAMSAAGVFHAVRTMI
jgi:type VII secretion integral membrane protein EccD